MTEKELRRVTVRFESAFTYDGGQVRRDTHEEAWEEDRELYCPGCGSPILWVESGSGDYDMGPEHFCTACGATCYLSLHTPSERSTREMERAKAILAACLEAPECRKGED